MTTASILIRTKKEARSLGATLSGPSRPRRDAMISVHRSGLKEEQRKEIARLAAPKEVPATSPPRRRSRPVAGATVVVISTPIDRAGIPALCDRVGKLLEASASDVVCDVGTILNPDTAAVDAVARLALTARRLDREIRWSHASTRLEQLLAFVGLYDAVGLGRGLPLESGGQAEERKHACGVEEEDDPGDLAP